jgi:hypothetical protein
MGQTTERRLEATLGVDRGLPKVAVAGVSTTRGVLDAFTRVEPAPSEKCVVAAEVGGIISRATVSRQKRTLLSILGVEVRW